MPSNVDNERGDHIVVEWKRSIKVVWYLLLDICRLLSDNENCPGFVSNWLVLVNMGRVLSLLEYECERCVNEDVIVSLLPFELLCWREVMLEE